MTNLILKRVIDGDTVTLKTTAEHVLELAKIFQRKVGFAELITPEFEAFLDIKWLPAKAGKLKDPIPDLALWLQVDKEYLVTMQGSDFQVEEVEKI